MSSLRQAFRKLLPHEGPPADPQRSHPLPVRAVRARLQQHQQPETAHAGPHRREAVPVRALRPVLHAEGLRQDAPAVVQLQETGGRGRRLERLQGFPVRAVRPALQGFLLVENAREESRRRKQHQVRHVRTVPKQKHASLYFL